MKKRSKYEKLREYIKRLCEDVTPLINLSDVHYEGHNWSVVKLLVLGSWSYVYTTIISKNWRGPYYYVDLLAGSGTTKVKETGDIVVGSAFVPHVFARHPYDFSIFVEIDEEKYKALHTRVAHLFKPFKYKILKGDCNKLIREITERMKRDHAHALVFVDNEGLDAHWNTINELLRSFTDILIVFPTAGIRRILGAWMRGTEFPKMDYFFGGPEWKERAVDEEELLEFYKAKIRESFTKYRSKDCYVSSIRIGEKRFYYDVILVCKKGPYVRAWEDLREKFDWLNPRIIDITLKSLKGEITSLDWFIDLQDRVEEIMGKQTKLDMFTKSQN